MEFGLKEDKTALFQLLFDREMKQIPNYLSILGQALDCKVFPKDVSLLQKFQEFHGKDFFDKKLSSLHGDGSSPPLPALGYGAGPC